jgi:hypothetical protein
LYCVVQIAGPRKTLRVSAKRVTRGRLVIIAPTTSLVDGWMAPVCSQCHAVYGRDEPPPPAPPQPSKPTPARPPTSRKREIEIRRPPRTEGSRDRPDPWVRRTPPTPSHEGDYSSEEALARERMIEMLNELFRRGRLRGRTPVDLDIPSERPTQHIAGGWLGFVPLFSFSSCFHS